MFRGQSPPVAPRLLGKAETAFVWDGFRVRGFSINGRRLDAGETHFGPDAMGFGSNFVAAVIYKTTPTPGDVASGVFFMRGHIGAIPANFSCAGPV